MKLSEKYQVDQDGEPIKSCARFRQTLIIGSLALNRDRAGVL